MPEVVIDGTDGRRLTIANPWHHDDPTEPWNFQATLDAGAATGSVGVWEHGAGLGVYFRQLADGWEGWRGTREYESLEGQLRITSRHDGRGLVACHVTLRAPEPPTWSLSAEMSLGAGAHLTRIAHELEQLLG
jgi:hypothetical protein